jgi:glycosyltransferase involved in cell wall biosynthesis
MKIVHLVAFFQPELGYEEYYTALKQVQMGLDVSVITSKRPFPYSSIKKISKSRNYDYSYDFKKIKGIKIYRLPCAFAFYDFIVLFGLRSLLKEIQPDIVHGHDPRSGFTALGAYHKDIGYKYILDQHEYSIPTNILLRTEYFILNKHVCNYAYDRAEKIISATQQTTEFLTEFYKLDGSKIVQLTLGADTEKFYFDEKARVNIRNELKIEEDETVFIFAGKLEKVGMFPKKVDLLIKAFAKVRTEHPSKLIIIGSGDEDYLSELKQLVDDLQIRDQVHFFEFQPQEKLREYYSASDVGVWPAQATMTIIEAMACKLAIIIPDRKTIRHLVSYKNGYLFPYGDLKILTEKLLSAASNSSELNEMRKRSEMAVKNELNYEAITKKVVNIYKECLK